MMAAQAQVGPLCPLAAEGNTHYTKSSLNDIPSQPFHQITIFRQPIYQMNILHLTKRTVCVFISSSYRHHSHPPPTYQAFRSSQLRMEKVFGRSKNGPDVTSQTGLTRGGGEKSSDDSVMSECLVTPL